MHEKLKCMVHKKVHKAYHFIFSVKNKYKRGYHNAKEGKQGLLFYFLCKKKIVQDTFQYMVHRRVHKAYQFVFCLNKKGTQDT